MSAPMSRRIYAAPRTTDFGFSPVRPRSRAKTCQLGTVALIGTSMGMQLNDLPCPSIADEAALFVWAETAPPGARAAYHIGHLACDRSPDMSKLSAQTRATLNSTAHRVMALVEQGTLIAVQQRLDDGRIAYLAIKTRRPAVMSRALRGHVPPERQRHFFNGTNRDEAHKAVQARNSSADPPSLASISAATRSVAQ